MNKRIFILFLLLGILIYTITLSEDTIPGEAAASLTRETTAKTATETENKENTSQGKGILTTVTEEQKIRVLLSREHEGDALADTITVSCSEAMTDGEHTYAAGETLFGAEDLGTEGIALRSEGSFQLRFDEDTDERSFTGTLYLYPQGTQLYVVNEISLEEYVACVVPGEMPAYYPEEALKAQAVCARTYALRHLEGETAYHADLGDSTSWQVFNSVGRTEETDRAVEETKGEVLYQDGAPAQLYFFSTSYGFGTVDDLWNGKTLSGCLRQVYIGKTERKLESEEAFAAYIKAEDENAWEKGEKWFRWQITFTQEELLAFCGKLQEVQGEIKDIHVTKRASGFGATEVTLQVGEDTLVVQGEYAIREFFSPEGIALQNQQEVETDRGVLPSGYFVPEVTWENGRITAVTLYGGGLGHGVGMSQNGAKNMAEAGWNYREILGAFFDIS